MWCFNLLCRANYYFNTWLSLLLTVSIKKVVLSCSSKKQKTRWVLLKTLPCRPCLYMQGHMGFHFLCTTADISAWKILVPLLVTSESICSHSKWEHCWLIFRLSSHGKGVLECKLMPNFYKIRDGKILQPYVTPTNPISNRIFVFSCHEFGGGNKNIHDSVQTIPTLIICIMKINFSHF